MRIDTSKELASEGPPKTLQILLLILATAVVTVLVIVAMVDPKWLAG
jgi:hypothetical protein